MRARAANAPKRRRRRNPVAVNRRRRHRRNPLVTVRHRRRRRNQGFGEIRGLATDAAYLAVGGITARSVPQLLTPAYNTGLVGYGLNMLTAFVTASLVRRWKSNAYGPWLLGGFAFTLSRVIDDYAGLKLVSFAQYTPPFQLAGDPHYGMAGVFASASLPLPSTTTTRALPPPPPPANGGNGGNGASAMSGAKWAGSYN